MLRPARASDAATLQNFFHNMSQEDRYTRFFQRLNNLTFSETQRLCNVDQKREVAFLAVTGSRENETVIGNACYFVNPSTNLGEVAYMVLPEWQGTGLGSALQGCLIEHAKSQHLRGFVAEILTNNKNMVKLAKRACDNVSVKRHDDTYEVIMLFDDESA